MHPIKRGMKPDISEKISEIFTNIPRKYPNV